MANDPFRGYYASPGAGDSNEGAGLPRAGYPGYGGYGPSSGAGPSYPYGQQQTSSSAATEGGPVDEEEEEDDDDDDASEEDEGPVWSHFIKGKGISREVIQTDIQRYLGPDACCKPGDRNGIDGYWISAPVTFTTAQLDDLKNDSGTWRAEKKKNPKAKYRSSQTHRSRQYWGASDQRSGNAPAPPVPRGGSSSRGERYTHQPTPTTGQTGSYSPPNPPYTTGEAAEQQPRNYPGHSVPPNYSGQNQSSQTVQNQQHYTGQSQQQYTGQSGYRTGYAPPGQQYQGHAYGAQAPPGHYLASDGNYYPLRRE